MSFSSDVKKELAALPAGARHCQIAELSALLLFCAGVTEEAGVFCLEPVSENEDVIRRIRFLIRKLTAAPAGEPVQEAGHRMGRELFRLPVPEEAAGKILQMTGALRGGALAPEGERFMDRLTVQKDCCQIGRAHV